MDISIIIVNYNTAAIISDCIDSLLKQQNIQAEIIVIDNASTDNSLDVLRNYGDKIKIIANPENSGFGKANNIAFKTSTGRYIFLLNPDACLTDANALTNLISFMDKHPDCGLAGPRVMKNQRITTPQHYYPGEKFLHKGFANLPGKIAWVIGACMIIRREVFAAVSGFDENYFLYAEETDLCLRIRQQGYTIEYFADVAVNHIGGASEKTNPTAAVWRRKQNGMHIFYRKHYPQDVKRLVTHDLKRAQFKLLLLRLKKIFCKLSLDNEGKLVRYKVIVDTSKEFLLQT